MLKHLEITCRQEQMYYELHTLKNDVVGIVLHVNKIYRRRMISKFFLNSFFEYIYYRCTYRLEESTEETVVVYLAKVNAEPRVWAVKFEELLFE